MLGTLIYDISCDLCNGNLSFDYEETFNAYKDGSDLTSLNIFEKVDSYINKYLVFTCNSCNIKYRYTYKDIENLFRNKIFKQLLVLLIQDQFRTFNAINDTVLIYCGKCTGYDGQSSCPRNVVSKCEIKKFPMR